jgi:hypothetical protein
MTTGQIARATSAALVFLLILAPGLLWAQSTIAGVVHDTSGAILPGVTVEAASPVLIEKTRTVVTDGEGAYRVVDLRPGPYTVTFSLSGFNTVKRDGIDLPPAFTATVNVEMGVGLIQETVTVSGAAPLVDVQNASSQHLMSPELLDSLPASRSPQGFAALTPGIISAGINTIGGGREELNLANHGSLNGESLFLIDGVSTAQMEGVGGANVTFRISEAYVNEINVATGGKSAEYQFSGTVTNVIPKEGGNKITGGLYTAFSTRGFQGNNLTAKLQAEGLHSTNKIVRIWDVQPAVGGPLIKDKIWFFSSLRNSSNTQTRAGVYENLTPTGWAYTPDLSHPAVIRITDDSYNTRLTWQATKKHKIAVFADFQPHIVYQRGYQVPTSPEATAYAPYLPNAVLVATWKGVLTNRLVLDVTSTHNSIDSNQRRQPGVGFDIISAAETTTGVTFRALSGVYTGDFNYSHRSNSGFRSNATLTYVTGSQTAKVGVQHTHGFEFYSNEVNGDLAYSLKNGVPTSITEYAGQYIYENMIHADVGLFAQDQWTLKRLTLTGGVRYDYTNIGAIAENEPAGFFVPTRSFPGTSHSPGWQNFSPRAGVSYNVFGDGKTALKATFGRFIQFQGASTGGINNSNPVVRSVLSVTRSWSNTNGTFNDTNGNLDPGCDLNDPHANGECGQISNLNFGQNNPLATVYAGELLRGLRPFNTEVTAGLQHQLSNGISVNVAYYRRSFHNFSVSDNILVTPADYSQYCITAPMDPRLPQGGGNQICGLYDVAPALFGKNQTVVKSASHFGKQTQIYNGFDLTENIRLPQGAEISGGMNWGRTETNACFVVNSPQALRFCNIKPPFLPNYTFAGFAPLPWGLVTSATYRNWPGTQIIATRQQVSNAEIFPSLGRNLSSGPNGTVNVELIQPGTMFGPRQQSIDFRFSKRFRFGSRRVTGNLDLYNLMNWASISTINTTYGPNWQQPTLVQLPRYVQLSAQIDF